MAEQTSPSWIDSLRPVAERADYRVPLKTPIHMPSGRMIHDVPGIFLRLPQWQGEPFVDDFGKKAGGMIELHGEHLFPELAVLRLLERDGWEGRWVNTQGAKGEVWKFLTRWDDVPREQQRTRNIEEEEPRRVLAKIASSRKKRYAGCWDVYAWRNGEFAFLDLRRGAPGPKDEVKADRIDWLHTALLFGDERIKVDSFAVVSWEFEARGEGLAAS
jgi:hypothetical protein